MPTRPCCQGRSRRATLLQGGTGVAPQRRDCFRARVASRWALLTADNGTPRRVLLQGVRRTALLLGVRRSPGECGHCFSACDVASRRTILLQGVRALLPYHVASARALLRNMRCYFAVSPLTGRGQSKPEISGTKEQWPSAICMALFCQVCVVKAARRILWAEPTGEQ